MKKMDEHMEGLLPDYFDNVLPPEQHAEVERYITENEAFAATVEQYRTLMQAIAEEPLAMPTKNLKKGFDAMLAEEKENNVKTVSLHGGTTKPWYIRMPKIAASIALLIAAFATGRYTQQKNMQTQLVAAENKALEYQEVAMISLLENESASKRIQGVELISEFEKPDTQIVNALGQKMLTDANTNVRLSAMEALAGFSYSEQVKTVFIKALETEKNPSIQVAIIQILAKMQEKKAIGPLKKLLENEDTQPFIKEEINSVLPKII